MPDKGTIPRVCETCGADFLGLSHQVNQGRARFCSADCYFRARYGEPHRLTVACVICGTTFETWPSRLRSGKGKYCGRSCARRGQTRPTPVRTPAAPRPSRADAFWASIDRSGGPDACWPWMKGRNNTGYGVASFRPITSKLAHRIAWEVTHGAPADGLNVLHHCDNPPCCNPAHLFLGSQADNNWDKTRKGRHHLQIDPSKAQGVLNPAARLTEDDVRAIRALRTTGASYPAIGARFGISKTMARNIVLRRAWSHVS